MRLPAPGQAPAATLVCLACVLFGFGLRARSVHLHTAATSSSVMCSAARYVDQLTPPNADDPRDAAQRQHALLRASNHAAIRLAADHRLDAAIRELKEKGYRPYIVMDDWEEVEFRKKFAAIEPRGSPRLAPARASCEPTQRCGSTIRRDAPMKPLRSGAAMRR